MKKIISKIAGTLLGISLAMGVGVAVAEHNRKAPSVLATEEEFYTMTPVSTGGNSSPHNSYTAAATATIDGIGWSVTGNSNMTPWRIGGKSLTNQERDMHTTTQMGSAITKVELELGAASSCTVSSIKLDIGSSESASDVDAVTKTKTADGNLYNTTLVYTPSTGDNWATNSYYKFTFTVSVSGTNNKYVEVKSVTFYHEVSGPATYTVSFEMGGHGSVESQKVVDGGYATQPADPSVTGYTFGGWFKSDMTTPFNFATETITGPTIVYAKWTAQSRTVSFNGNGNTSGTVPASIVSSYDAEIDLPDQGSLAKTGYIFSGWCETSDGTGTTHEAGTKFTVQDVLTLYAKWSVKGGKFLLVEDASTLVKGDKIVIANSKEDGSAYGLSTTQNTNNRAAKSVSIASGVLESTTDIVVFTLNTNDDLAKSSSNHWVLAVEGGYLYAAGGSSSNHLKTQSALTTDGQWEFSINSDGTATITAQGTATRNVMRYNPNSGSPIFACYASTSTTGTLPYIYRITEAEDFAQSFLDAALCDNGVTAPSASLWGDLSTAYSQLSVSDKEFFDADIAGDESGSVVEKCLARYDYIVGKYGKTTYTDFMNRNPAPIVGANTVTASYNSNNNSSTIIIVVVALTSITSIGVLLVIKRKRSLVK